MTELKQERDRLQQQLDDLRAEPPATATTPASIASEVRRTAREWKVTADRLKANADHIRAESSQLQDQVKELQAAYQQKTEDLIRANGTIDIFQEQIKHLRQTAQTVNPASQAFATPGLVEAAHLRRWKRPTFGPPSRPRTKASHVRPLHPAGHHSRGTCDAACSDPGEGQHHETIGHRHPYVAPTDASAFSQPGRPTTSGARSGRGHGLHAPERARVPAVKATTGSKSKSLLLLLVHP